MRQVKTPPLSNHLTVEISRLLVSFDFNLTGYGRSETVAQQMRTAALQLSAETLPTKIPVIKGRFFRGRSQQLSKNFLFRGPIVHACLVLRIPAP